RRADGRPPGPVLAAHVAGGPARPRAFAIHVRDVAVIRLAPLAGRRGHRRVPSRQRHDAIEARGSAWRTHGIVRLDACLPFRRTQVVAWHDRSRPGPGLRDGHGARAPRRCRSPDNRRCRRGAPGKRSAAGCGGPAPCTATGGGRSVAARAAEPGGPRARDLRPVPPFRLPLPWRAGMKPWVYNLLAILASALLLALVLASF